MPSNSILLIVINMAIKHVKQKCNIPSILVLQIMTNSTKKEEISLFKIPAKFITLPINFRSKSNLICFILYTTANKVFGSKKSKMIGSNPFLLSNKKDFFSASVFTPKKIRNRELNVVNFTINFF